MGAQTRGLFVGGYSSNEGYACILHFKAIPVCYSCAPKIGKKKLIESASSIGPGIAQVQLPVSSGGCAAPTFLKGRPPLIKLGPVHKNHVLDIR